MQIKTANGWRDLVPKNITPPQHVKTLLEENGLTGESIAPQYRASVKAFLKGKITKEVFQSLQDDKNPRPRNQLPIAVVAELNAMEQPVVLAKAA